MERARLRAFDACKNTIFEAFIASCIGIYKMLGKGVNEALGGLRTHGVYAIQDRGEKALEGANRTLLMELEEEMTTREGNGALQRRRAALAVIIVGKIKQQVESQVESGTPFQEIPIL